MIDKRMLWAINNYRYYVEIIAAEEKIYMRDLFRRD